MLAWVSSLAPGDILGVVVNAGNPEPGRSPGAQGQAASSLFEELQDTEVCLKKQSRSLTPEADF